ncbi:Uncharacterised protein [Mycobacterium tuberculosis]|nr:Uncharacterised protein [Mycobacterium tuberculosis]
MNEGGRPPRNQRRSAAEDPTSRTVRPDNSTNSTRPAKLSDASPTRSGEALPRIRNRAGTASNVHSGADLPTSRLRVVLPA